MLLTPTALRSLLVVLVYASGLSQVRAAVGSHQPRSRQHVQLARRDATMAATEKRGENHGMATFYNAETGNMGACGWFISNSDWTVAIKGSMYGDYGRKSSWCGQKITITANGKTARNVVIGDACPGCPEGASLDMTPELFKYFANPDKGVIPISWHLSSEDGDEQEKEWKPLSPAKNIWKAPTPAEKQDDKAWKPSKMPSSSKDSQPTPTWTPAAEKKVEQMSLGSTLSSVLPLSNSSLTANITLIAPGNTTVSSNSTLLNSTEIETDLRRNNTVALLPSNALTPARVRPSNGKADDTHDSTRGNLHRAAQIVLDLAGLAYSAAHK